MMNEIDSYEAFQTDKDFKLNRADGRWETATAVLFSYQIPLDMVVREIEEMAGAFK